MENTNIDLCNGHKETKYQGKKYIEIHIINRISYKTVVIQSLNFKFLWSPSIWGGVQIKGYNHVFIYAGIESDSQLALG